CSVSHVVQAPQSDGTNFFVVFRNATSDVYPLAGPHVPKGPFSLVSSDGTFVPVFSGANVLDAEDALFSYDGRGSLAIAHQVAYGPSGSPWTVQMLHVVPVTPEQRPILSVIVGPPFVGFMSGEKHFAWTWQTQPSQTGGPPDIVIGPRGPGG